MVDTRDLKSLGHCGCTSSSLVSGTSLLLDFQQEGFFVVRFLLEKGILFSVSSYDNPWLFQNSFSSFLLVHEDTQAIDSFWVTILNELISMEDIIKYCCLVNFPTAQESFLKPFRIGLRAGFFAVYRTVINKKQRSSLLDDLCERNGVSCMKRF